MELKDSAIQISISIHTNPQVLSKVPNICQKIVLKQTFRAICFYLLGNTFRINYHNNL